MPHVKHSLFPDTIESKVADLNTKNNYLKVNAGRFGISSADISKVNTLVTAVNTAHTKASDLDMRTKTDIANRKQAIRTAQETVRKVIAYYVIGNLNTTDVDYKMLNIHRPSPYPHLPAPEHIPGIGHIISEDLTVVIPFFDAQTGKRAKPEGVRSIEAHYKIGGEPPTNPSDMTGHKVDTASPMRLQFEFGNEMEVLYIVFRWIGTRGDYSPWSEIYKIVIAR
jgi:hypothetical protein